MYFTKQKSKASLGKSSMNLYKDIFFNSHVNAMLTSSRSLQARLTFLAVPAQRAYLQVPQNVYVDREGNIVEMPSGSRSHRSGDTAEAPATKAMLSIVFDDEPHGGDSGETTGINTVSERNIDSDAWFTLQGVRVNAPAKGGIYIHKGRKVVVK